MQGTCSRTSYGRIKGQCRSWPLSYKRPLADSSSSADLQRNGVHVNCCGDMEIADYINTAQALACHATWAICAQL
jgi:hypothetical protein